LNREVGAWGIASFAERYGLDLRALPESDRANPVRVVRAVERRLLDRERASLPDLPWHSRRFKFALQIEREALKRRLAERLDAMLAAGWVEEVETLLRQYPEEAPAFRSIGYREIAKVIQGLMSLQEARSEILARTWSYARRQMTWLRKEPNLIWISGEEAIDQQVSALYGYIHRAEG
jgi:tRNA dimethylallyltransferase